MPTTLDEPSASTARSSGSRLVYGLSALALVLLLVAVWGVGGFEKRQDRLRLTPVGTVFTTGPYEYRFTGATAQQVTDYHDQRVWEVTALGLGRTIGDVSLQPDDEFNSIFVSKDDVTQEVATPEGTPFGPPGPRSQRHEFAPGLPPVEFRVVFHYSERYRPGPTIRFGVADQVFANRYLVGGEAEWHHARTSRLFLLPVRVLPPAPT